MITPIYDEDSRQNYIDGNELKQRIFEAKWKWQVDKTVTALAPTDMALA